MCGIYGWQIRPGHKLSTYESTILGLTLAEEMEDRGRDSFGGLFWPNPEAEPEMVTTPEVEEEAKTKDKGVLIVRRGLGKATEKDPEFLQKFASTQIMFGHTRAATMGATTIKNTHPFVVGDVIGVHNGMVYNHYNLKKKYNRDYDVDSQHIFAHINAGLDLEELDGYGTALWTRQSEGYSNL